MTQHGWMIVMGRGAVSALAGPDLGFRNNDLEEGNL
tara:strand:+ start:529 stop:636 length:108 start_codon:yes stop_codon:yes gene_type:complete